MYAGIWIGDEDMGEFAAGLGPREPPGTGFN